jgi:CBS domain-containing protein
MAMATRSVGQLIESVRREVLTIAPEATVQEALERMAEMRISSLPVTAGAELVGILSERDYIRKAVTRRIAPWDLQVREIMTREVITVTREDSIQTCMELMTSRRIRHLPVVEGQRLVGMLSISDIVRALRPAKIEFPER